MAESSIVIAKQFNKDYPRKELVDFFSTCGNLTSLTVVGDQADSSLGIAIVSYKDPAHAKIAAQLSGSILGDKAITTRVAPPAFVAPPGNPNDEPLPVNMDTDQLTAGNVFVTLISKGFVLSDELMQTYGKSTKKAATTQQNVIGTCTIQSSHGTYLRGHPGKEGLVDLQEHPGVWETWTIESLGDNLVCIKSYHNSMLRANRGGAGSKVSLTTINSAETQWVLIQHDNGSGHTFQSCYGTFLRAYTGGESAKVDLQTNIGAWETFRIAGRILTKALKSYHGTFVRAHPGGDGSKVDMKSPCGPWETFVVEKLADNKIALKTMHGTYLCAHAGGDGSKVDLQSRIGLSEQWTLVEHQGGRYSFLSCHGTYLRANKGDGAKVDLSTKVGNFETFTIEDGVKPDRAGVATAKIAGTVNSFKNKLGK